MNQIGKRGYGWKVGRKRLRSSNVYVPTSYLSTSVSNFLTNLLILTTFYPPASHIDTLKRRIEREEEGWSTSKRKKRNNVKYGKKKRKLEAMMGCLQRTIFRRNRIGVMMISCDFHITCPPLTGERWGRSRGPLRISSYDLNATTTTPSIIVTDHPGSLGHLWLLIISTSEFVQLCMYPCSHL